MTVESRLKVIGKLRLDYEVPFVSDRGKVLGHTILRINEVRKGVAISYALLGADEQALEALFPREGMDALAEMALTVLADLGIAPQKTALQMWDYSVNRGPYSLEGRAPVNRQRDTVLIIFVKSPLAYKFNYEMVLGHQCMHAKDRWERRFPAAHPQVQTSQWLDALWHFSIDGRLQARGWPHYAQEERLEEAASLFGRMGLSAHASGRALAACRDLWGREVTLDSLMEMGRDLGLEAGGREASPRRPARGAGGR